MTVNNLVEICFVELMSRLFQLDEAERLGSRTDIRNWKASEEFDLRHGNFNDLEDGD